MTREERIQFERERDARADRMATMLDSVKEVELQARYWKATYETKHWTLEDAKLKDAYEKYFMEVQTRAEDAALQLEKLQALGGLTLSEEDNTPTTDGIITSI